MLNNETPRTEASGSSSAANVAAMWSRYEDSRDLTLGMMAVVTALVDQFRDQHDLFSREVRLLDQKIEELTGRVEQRDQLLKIGQVAKRWQVSNRTVANLFAEGKLPATYINGSQRFTLEAVEAAERAWVSTKPKRKFWGDKG